MKKINSTNGVRTEYDFASMKGGVRGKYAKRYAEGTNIVLLEPDIAEAFPNDEAVNQALRGVLNTTRAVRGYGGTRGQEPATRHPAPKPSIQARLIPGSSEEFVGRSRLGQLAK